MDEAADAGDLERLQSLLREQAQTNRGPFTRASG
jgi:hypothetical protein